MRKNKWASVAPTARSLALSLSSWPWSSMNRWTAFSKRAWMSCIFMRPPCCISICRERAEGRFIRSRTYCGRCPETSWNRFRKGRATAARKAFSPSGGEEITKGDYKFGVDIARHSVADQKSSVLISVVRQTALAPFSRRWSAFHKPALVLLPFSGTWTRTEMDRPTAASSWHE